MNPNNNTSISEETQKKFEQIEYESQRASKFINLKSGETRTLRFNPEKFELVDDEFDGKVTKRVHYTVIDAELPTEEEKILPMSLTNSRNINALLAKGMNVIEIKRIGHDQNTKYTFVPII